MRRLRVAIPPLVGVLLAAGCSKTTRVPRQRSPKPTEPACTEPKRTLPTDRDLPSIRATLERLRLLHAPLEPPGPNDWLAVHHEPGQSFEAYLRHSPVRAVLPRRTIVIQPIGQFKAAEQRAVEIVAQYLEIYFGLPVRVESSVAVDASWPASARRIHPEWGDEQLNASHILSHVLRPRLPDDAATCLGLTAWDLWPGPGWNFVFGLASTQHRVGVWSIYRHGNPEQSPDAFKTVLRRTMKTATHETGHMFSMHHCTAYRCNMCGSNHREESDRRPPYLCPQCLGKLHWATGTDIEQRFGALAEFSKKHGLDTEAAFYERSRQALGVRR